MGRQRAFINKAYKEVQNSRQSHGHQTGKELGNEQKAKTRQSEDQVKVNPVNSQNKHTGNKRLCERQAK